MDLFIEDESPDLIRKKKAQKMHTFVIITSSFTTPSFRCNIVLYFHHDAILIFQFDQCNHLGRISRADKLKDGQV